MGRWPRSFPTTPSLSPPDGFVLEPKGSWTVSAHAMMYNLRHWTDGANTAYLAFADGTTAAVAVAPTHAVGDNATLKRGAEIYPVPDQAPVPVSIVPWPQSVAVSGRLAMPAGLDLSAKGGDAEAAAASFAELVDSLFPVEGIVRPAAEGGFPVSVSRGKGFGPEAYAIAFSPTGAAVSGGTRTGMLYGLITLGQILRGARQHPETFLFPAGGEIRDEPGLGWRGIHLDVARQFYADRGDYAIPEDPRLEQAQPVPLASVRRRGVARRDRRLSPADGGRRLARPRLEGPGAARLRPAAVRRLLQQGGDPRDRRARRPARHRR